MTRFATAAYRRALAAGLLTLAALGPLAARGVLVMDADQDGAAVVLAEQATTAAQYAALELQHHLELITGVKPAIVREPQAPAKGVRLAVGNTALGRSLGLPVDRLAPWEFLVAERQGVIVLAGGDAPFTDTAQWGSLAHLFDGQPNGTCRAAFEFLERYCGVHWYLPSPAGLVHPTARRLVADFGPDVRRRTDFRSTSVYPYLVNGRMYSPLQLTDATGSRAGYRNPIQRADLLSVLEVQRWLLRNKVGGEPYGPNHSFGNWLERFGKDHPTWFSYRTPEKIAPLLAAHPQPGALSNAFHETGNPCLSDPGVFQQVLADAEDYYASAESGGKRRPAAGYFGSAGHFFGIVLNDNYAMCPCPACRAQYGKPAHDTPMWAGADGSVSFYLWDFVNRAAREVRRKRPDAWIGGIAYHNYMPPPQNFTLEPNVAVTICTYLGNWTPRLRETAYSLIRAWREQAKCQWLGTWEYQCYSALGAGGPQVPRVCPRHLGQDVKALHRLGVVAEFMEQEDHYGLAPGDQMAVWSNPIWLYLNTWIRFKLYDDVGRDPNQWLDEHYRLFYGPAEQPIRAFYDRLEQRITDRSLRGPATFTNERSQNPAVDWEVLFPPPVMTELRASIDEATRLATAEPYRTRVGWVRAGLMEHMERFQRQFVTAKAAAGRRAPAQIVGYRLPAAPTVDGRGDEPVWQGLPTGRLGDWRSGADPQAATWFKLGYDDANLYLLARCDEPNMPAIRAEQQDRDSDVWTDDCVEWHLTPDPERNFAWQIVVNSRGVVEDLRYQRNEGGEMVGGKLANCPGLVAAATRDAGGYTVEVKLPLADLGGPALRPGACLAMNLCRERYAGATGGTPTELQSWSPAPEGFGNPATFGRALLVPGDGFSVYFQPTVKLPDPFAYLVTEGKAEWTVDRQAMTAAARRDHVAYTLKQTPREGLRSIKGTLTWSLPQPVTVADHPLVELRYRKPRGDLFLQVVYNYDGEDGKPAWNWFMVSPMDLAEPAVTTTVRRLGEGGEPGRPKPVRLRHLTLHAVVYGDRTPPDCGFELYHLRVGNTPFPPERGR